MSVERSPYIASDKRTGKAARFTTLTNGWTVETYYNRSVVSFCTCVKDDTGAFKPADKTDDLYEYAGGVSWARRNHEEAIKRVIGIILLEKVQ